MLWDVNKGQLASSISTGSSVYALATHDAGNLIATCSSQKSVQLFDPGFGKHHVMTLSGHTDRVRCLLMSENGRWVSTSFLLRNNL